MIHQLLADNSMAPGSRHFLAQDRCDVIRSFTATGLSIDGSSYLPPQAEDRPAGYLNREFARFITSANAFSDAVNASFFIMTRLPYLQAFYDANKRTSRISCNIPLIKDGLAPLSFVDFEKRRYLEGLIAFYELGDERLAKNAWLDAYLASAFRYLPFGEEARFALSVQRDEQLAAARRYVVDGVLDADLLWLRKH
jgi:Fic family protein